MANVNLGFDITPTGTRTNFIGPGKYAGVPMVVTADTTVTSMTVAIVDVGDTIRGCIYDEFDNLVAQTAVTTTVAGDNVMAFESSVVLYESMDYWVGLYSTGYTSLEVLTEQNLTRNGTFSGIADINSLPAVLPANGGSSVETPRMFVSGTTVDDANTYNIIGAPDVDYTGESNHGATNIKYNVSGTPFAYTASSGDAIRKIKLSLSYPDAASLDMRLFAIRLDTKEITHLTTVTYPARVTTGVNTYTKDVDWALEDGVEYGIGAATDDGSSITFKAGVPNTYEERVTNTAPYALNEVLVGDGYVNGNTGAITGFVLENAVAPMATITDIDGDNDVMPGQTATITGENLGTVSSVTLGGEPLVLDNSYSAGSSAFALTAPNGLVEGEPIVLSTDASFGSMAGVSTYSSVNALASLSDTQEVPSAGLGGFSSETAGSRLAVTIENGVSKRNTLPSILAENNGDNNGAANSTLVLDHGASIPENTKILWSSVDRMTPKSGLGGDGQWKIRRLGVFDNITDNNEELIMTRTDQDNGTNGLGYVARTNLGQVVFSAQSGGNIANNNFPQFDDTWRRIDQFIDTGTEATYDGSVQIIGHYPDLSAPPAQLPMVEYDANTAYPDQVRVYGTPADRFRYFIHQNFFGNGSGAEGLKDFGAEVRHENIFIQVGSYKRFELCNNATYASATIREIQPHSAWATDEATVTFVRGSLPSGAAWLHEIDDNGNSVRSVEVVLP